MSAIPYITCRELVDDFIARYLERTLSDAEASDFERHLSVCPPCRAYLATYEKAVLAGRAVMRNEESALQDAPEDLIRAVLSVARRRD